MFSKSITVTRLSDCTYDECMLVCACGWIKGIGREKKEEEEEEEVKHEIIVRHRQTIARPGDIFSTHSLSPPYISTNNRGEHVNHTRRGKGIETAAPVRTLENAGKKMYHTIPYL